MIQVFQSQSKQTIFKVHINERVFMKKIIILALMVITGLSAQAKSKASRFPAQAAPKTFDCVIKSADATGWQILTSKSAAFGPDALNPSTPNKETTSSSLVIDIKSPRNHKIKIEAEAFSQNIIPDNYRANHIFVSLFINEAEIQYTSSEEQTDEFNAFNLKDKKTGEDVTYSFVCSIKE
jgi:hypothetical protein